MFESKDASKSDERRVKNTLNSKPLTRKRKGETHTMGNRGIQLSVVFVISLMLIAAVFSTTAMAGDGDGTAKVSWAFEEAVGNARATIDTTGGTPVGSGDTLDNSETVIPNTDPLNAGSRFNVIKIVFTATMDDGLGGGLVRVALPGWAMGTIADNAASTTDIDEKGHYKYVRITSAPTNGTEATLYNTDATTQSAVKADVDMVSTINADMVEVKLSNEWSAGGVLTIRLGDVTTGIPNRLSVDRTDDNNGPYSNYPLRVSSRTKNGTLVAIDSSPNVRVGNIAGLRTVDADDDNPSRDTVKRVVEIDPGKAYQGEMERTFKITFTVPGPIYDSSTGDTSNANFNIVTIPASLEVDFSTISVLNITGLGDFTAPESGAITVPLKAVNKGQIVTVRFTADVNTTAETDFADTDIQTSVAVGDGTASTTNVTEVTGGAVETVEGSGTVTIDPVALESAAPRKQITLIYTADTDLPEDYVLEIMPEGIVIDADNKLTKGTSGAYTVSSSSHDSILSVNEDGDTITFTDIGLDKSKTLSATIRDVKVESESKEYEWTVRVGLPSSPGVSLDDTGGDDIATQPKLSVVKTSSAAVDFDIVGSDSDKVLAARALGKTTIEFVFTAESTAIRGGLVSLTIPEALGTAPSNTKDAAGYVTVDVSGGNLVTDPDQKDKFVKSGGTITADIKDLGVGGTVTIKYADGILNAKSQDVPITALFKTSEGGSSRTAGTATVRIGKIADGTGTAIIKTNYGRSLVESGLIEAGSNHRVVTVEFTAVGTMDGGAVSLEIPPGWGAMQNDPTKRNYVTARGVGVESVDQQGSQTIVNISKLAASQSFDIIYGGGTGTRATNGVEVQDGLGTAQFKIKSDGDGDGVFALITSTTKHEKREKDRNPNKTGKIYDGAPGILQLEITTALDGTGTATVTDADGNAPAIRAAADEVMLVFTYTPSQTIEDGALEFTVPRTWSKPQVEDLGAEGSTEVESTGVISTATDDDGYTVTIPITSLDKEQTITIKYGGTGTGGAKAASKTGDSEFIIKMKGHADGKPTALIDGTPGSVTVARQGSGKGTADLAVTGDAVHAGDMDREITVTYTAAGEMVVGSIELGIPANWSPPTADNVKVMPEMPLSASSQMVTVEGVNLDPNSTVTFVYTAATVQPTNGTAAFTLKSHGGLEDDVPAAVPVAPNKTLTVDVGFARAGSGMGMVEPRIVEAGDEDAELTFTYTAVGRIEGPREFRVQVPTELGWSQPSGMDASDTVKGTYTVVHVDVDGFETTYVEKLAPVNKNMVARVRLGGIEVEKGDQITFTYQNAQAPMTVGVSPFKLIFDGQVVDDVSVRVQDSMPSMLNLRSAGTVSADEGAMLQITVELQDADGKAVAMNSDAMVTLTSTLATGVFSMAGEAVTTVTIDGGETSTMVYYMDSTAGTATINASAPGTNLTAAMPHEVTVTAAAVVPGDPEMEPVVAITEGSIMVSPSLAMGTIAGTAVTVSAMGTAGQMATFSIGSIVTDGSMTEDEAGSYSGSASIVVDQHADGMYDVSVTLNADATTTMTAADALTIDSTDPTVTVTAPESAMDGDEVMISATVTDAGMISSVTADVSMLDSTQTEMVTLPMGEDGAYGASITISDENENANGPKTVTVTAMDAAGNSGTGEATVMLANTLSYTSMIPAGLSLFHVPLDVDGLDTVGDLKGMIGNGSNLAIVYDHATGSWNSRSDDVMITADLGIVLSMGSAATYTFEGEAWDGGASMISLQAGPNLIGLPVNDPRVMNVSDIAGLFTEGVVSSIVISTDDGFKLVSDTVDAAVMGDAAYLVTASAAAPATLLGDGWTYSDMAGAAPIALAGFSVEGQTPVLDVNGSIVDEITGLAREGFRVKVKNLSTKASLNRVTSLEVEAGGYNMTFVDLKSGNAARIGDVLEISADSPSPLIGVQPVRHIVTADDVKSGILELEDLIAYEIPAETELLRNYPNPFNPETWIPYRLAEDADVSLTIYDVNGELVRSIDVGHQSAAVYESRAKAIYWDGRNRFGEQVASGIYFYSLSTGDFSATRKMVILK